MRTTLLSTEGSKVELDHAQDQCSDGYRLRITMMVALIRQFGFDGTLVIFHEARALPDKGLLSQSFY